MKKSRLLLAAGVFTVAFGAAFATKAHQNDVALGYVQLPSDCQQVTNVPAACGPQFENICTVDDIIYYQSRDTSDPTVCVNEFKMP